MPYKPAAELIRHFQAFLSEVGLSGISIKNYVSDLRQFLVWAHISHAAQIHNELIPSYLNLIKQSKPLATYRRYLASMRRFVTFLEIEYRINLPQIAPSSNHQTDSQTPQTMTTTLQGFRKYLENEKKSPSTIKNYISDLNHFYNWIAKNAKNQENQTNFPGFNLSEILAPKTLKAYTNQLELSQTKSNVIHRREAAINKFIKFTTKTSLTADSQASTTPSPLAIFVHNKGTYGPIERLGGKRSLYARYHTLPFVPYLHLALLVLFTMAIGIFGYTQIIRQAPPGRAFLTTPPRPARQLSFQGRLTDPNDAPITQSTTASFSLYNQTQAGTEVYSATGCLVVPNENGIFSTQIGNGQCGVEIDADVFSENQNLFLEVSVGGQTLTPRQPIATGGYALNSETLQGYPASASATENTVPVVNNNGDIIINASSPGLVSTNGTFAIKGQTITLATETGTDGNIDLVPDGRGQVNLIGNLDKGILFNVTDANLTTGTLIEAYAANNSRTGTLLHLASGTKKVNRLTVYSSGQTDIIAQTYTKPAFSIKQTGTGPIFSAKTGSTQVAQLSAAGDLGLIGGLSLGTPYSTHAWPGQILTNINSRGMAGVIINQNDSGPILAASSSGLPKFVIANNGNVGINTLTPNEGSLVVVGRTWTDQFTMAKNPVSGYILTSDNGGNATWAAPGGSAEGWSLDAPIVYPDLTSYQVLVGATATASALGKLTVYGDSTSAPIAYLSGTTAAAALIIDNLGSGNLINASSGGVNKFTVANDGDITSAAIALAGGAVWTDSAGNLNSVAGTAGQCLTSGGSGTPVWTSCSVAADNFWQRNLGVLSPLNITDDLAIGGTATSSAKFQIFADTGNATTSGNLTFTGTTSTIATRLNRSLTLGDSQTGNILIAPGGTTALTAIGNDVTVADDLTVTGDNITLAGNSTTIDMTGTGTLSLNTTTNRAITTGTGQVILAGNVDATNGLDVTNADLTVGGANFSVDDATGNIVTAGTLTLPNSNTLTGVTSFTQFSQGVDVNGNATISGNLTFYGGARTIASRLNTTLTLGDSQTGNILIAPGGTTALTAIGNDVTVADDLTVVSDVTINTLNTAGAVVYADVNGTLRITAQGVADQCLVSAGAGAPIWTSCSAAASNFWQRNAGVLSPLNITDDLAVGGTATASAKFQIFADTGNATTSGNLTFNTTGTIQTTNNQTLTLGGSSTGNIILAPTSGNIGITNISPTEKLDVVGNATISGNLIFYGGARTIASRLNTTLTIGDTQTGNILIAPGGTTALTAISNDVTVADDLTIAGEDLLTSSSTFNLINATATTVNFAGAASTLNIGPGGTTATSVNLAGGSSATGCTVDGATGNLTCSGSITGTGTIGYWQRNIGALSPANLTDDLLLGATSTASAKFAFYNVASGTPTASVSGSTTNVATSLDGNGNLITTNKKSLTLGNADTGNIIINGDLVGVNNTSPLASFDVASIIGTLPIASVAGATSMAALVVDNSGVGDIFTASSSGLNRFVITQSGNVGIGVNQPSEVLGVVGNATISGNLTFYGGARTIASRLNTTLTFGDTQTGNIILAPGGTTALTAIGNDIILADDLTINGDATISATLALGPLTQGQAGTCNASATGKIYYDGPTTSYFYCNGTSWTSLGSGPWTRVAPYVYLTTGTDQVGVGTATPVGKFQIVNGVGTTSAASISATSSFAALVVDNSGVGDLFTASSAGASRLRLERSGDLTLYGSSGAVSPPTGRLMPFVDAVQAIGSSTQQWHSINLSNSINNAGNVSINLQTQHFGDNGTGSWTFDNDASVSGDLNVVGTTWLGCNVAAPPGCGNPLSSTLIVGVAGTGKIDVGTIDPPYTINNEKYATYIASMVGQNEEIAGQIETGELITNVGYRSIIDFRSLPKASNLWLFGKVANIKEHIGQMSVILTPGSAARAWYEIDPERKLLTIYSSKPTVVSYRLTAPRFDSEKWKNTRPQEALTGFILNDPDLPLSQLNDPPITLDVIFSESNINQYQLKLGSTTVSEIGSYANLLVANLSAGAINTKILSVAEGLTTGLIKTQKIFASIGNFDLIKTGKLESPLAEIDTLRIKTSLISPLAQINEIIAGTVSAQTIIADQSQISNLKSQIATVSGTLYAKAIDSPEISNIKSQISNLSSDYASASAILASLKAKYNSFDSLNSPVAKTDPLNTTDLSPENATISGTLVADQSEISNLKSQMIFADTLLVNTTLISNSLNSADTTLYIQPTATHPINLLAGLMTLTPDGKVNINGNLRVTGNIAAKTISLTEGLSSQTATISGSGQLLSLFNDHGDLVGSIDASGAASFGQLAGNRVIASGLVIASGQNGTVATDSASVKSNSTIGTAVIPTGTTELTINNSAIRSSTYIYLTPISDTDNQVLYIKTKEEGVGFTVAINQPTTSDLQFSYWLIQTQP